MGPAAAVALSLLHGVIFILPFYAEPRDLRTRSRDDPRKIRYRMATATLSTLLSLALTAVLLPAGQGPGQSVTARLGLTLDGAPVGVATAVGLTALFYLGHLLRLALDRSPPQALDMHGYVAFRNLAFAPVVEELVFRSCVAAALGAGGAGFTARVWVSPLFFGVAHLHHAVEELRKGRLCSRVAVFVLAQATYTTLFGAYATFLLLATGSVLPPIAAHVVCNALGLPDLDFLRPASSLHRHRHLLAASLVAGPVLFSFALWTAPL